MKILFETGKVIDSLNEPIILIMDEEDKNNICQMPKGYLVYGSAPENMRPETLQSLVDEAKQIQEDTIKELKEADN